MRPLLPAVALALLALASLPVRASGADAPILISSDADLARFPGAGTPDSPYVIEGPSITATSAHGIDVENTQKWLAIRNATVSSGGGSFDGIRVVNARNVTVTGATLETDRIAILVQASRDVTITSSTAKSSRIGVQLVDATNVTIADSRLSVNDRDVDLLRSTNNTLHNDNLSIATGQFGVFFEDASSYDNHADPSNVVNAIPLPWYADLASPGTISPPTVDLRGVTNVAQLLFYNVSGANVTNAVAKSGAAAGVLCAQCQNVTFAAPDLEANAGPGADVEGGANVTLADAVARANGAQGVLLAGVADAQLQRATVRSNVAEGVLARAAPRARIENGSFAGNGGVDASLQGTAGALVRGTTFASATPTALWLSSASATIDASSFSGHAQAIRFTSATGSVATANVITVAAGQTAFSFDGEDAYNNSLDASNTVNGVATRWFTNVHGTSDAPITLPTVSADVPGMTNVAQVMLYQCANVTLPSANARNGTAAGIVVDRSENLTIASPTAASNAGVGIAVLSSSNVSVSSGDAHGNGDHGVRVLSSSGALVQNNVVQANRGRGVSVESSPLATLRGNGVVNNARSGIFVTLSAPGPATIESNLVQANAAGGIFVDQSALGSLRNNTVDANGDTGLQLSSAAGALALANNTITNHTRDVRLLATQGAVAENNTLLTRAGQYGFWFDDETSYNNTLLPTNTVNGVALRWYVSLNATNVSDVDVELPGITNVAQAMLYRATNVTLANATLANGTARGLYVYHGDNVTARGLVVTNVTLAGVHAQASRSVRVDGARVTAAGARGAWADGTDLFWLTNATVTRAGAEGVAVTSSAGAIIEDSQLAANAGGDALLDHASRASVRRDSMRDAPFGLSLSSGSDALVDNDSFANDSRAVQVVGATGSRFENDTIGIDAGQTGYWFVDAGSYDNSISTTSTVNGEPVRWYTHLRDAVLRDVRAEAPGVTNVAQLTLLDADNVSVENATLANGTARGALVIGSGRVTLANSTVRGVASHGIEARGVAQVNVSAVLVRDAGGSGLLLSDATANVSNATILNATLDGVTGVRGRLILNDSTIRLSGGNGVALSAPASANVSRTDVESSRGGRGIDVDAATGPVDVSDDTVTANALDGIALHRLVGATLARNVVTSNLASGILLDRVGAGTLVDGNQLSNDQNGVRLAATEYVTINGTRVNILAGQTGLRFDDEQSFDNAIPLTNVVNGVPVRWFTTLAGTQSSPVRLPDIDVELPGITNVAQVMVYRSAYVDLSGTVATNGTNRGIYVYRSSNVLIDRANASGNARAGVHLASTQSSVVTNLSARSTGTAVYLTSSVSNDVERVEAVGSGAGVVIGDGDSRGNVVQRVEIDGAHPGVQDPTATSALRGGNLLADAGSAKRAKVGVPVSFQDPSATARFDSERITSQSWDFGDGQTQSSAVASLLTPTHTYVSAGSYQATLTIQTADGQTLSDLVNVTVVPPLSAPRNVVVTSGNRNATVAWQAPAFDGGASVAKYRVYRGADAASLAQVAELDASAGSWLDAGSLVNGATYAYAVSAVTADGEGPRSAVAIVVPATTPGVPGPLTAIAGAANASLSWSGGDSGGLPVTGYRVWRGPDDANLTLVATLGNVTTFLDVGLTNGASYHYAVDAVNALGNGSRTASAVVTPLSVPAAPWNLTLLPGDTSATLAWSAPNDTGGLPILAYRVYRGPAEGALAPLPDLGNVTTLTDPGLANDKSYAYAVAAVNKLGVGNLTPVRTVVPSAVDKLPPAFLLLQPVDGSHTGDTRPMISARFVDNVGVAPASVRLLVDGVDVTRNASLAATSIAYVPASDLAPGNHTVRLDAADASRNAASTSWSFRVLAPEERVAVLVFSNLTLDPPQVDAGQLATARVHVANVGLAPANTSVALLEDGAPLANATVVLADGAEGDIVYRFVAVGVGAHALAVGNESANLTVNEPAPLAPPPTPSAGDLKDDPVMKQAAQEAAKTVPAGPAALAALAIAALARRGGKRGR